MLYLSSRVERSEDGCFEVKIRIAAILIFAAAGSVGAQGVEGPPVTSFKPDTLLPKVSVPEFVITGRAQIDVTRFDKQSTEIDSSYFQGRALADLKMAVPVNQALSLQSPGRNSTDLYARLSSGSYATSSYLVSGGVVVSGILLNGSTNGNYTSGYTPQTMSRDFSIQAGAAKDLQLDESAVTNNSAEIRFSRASYFLYGTGTPNLLRAIYHFDAGLHSDIDFNNFPLAVGLSFGRFSVEDSSKEVQTIFGVTSGTVLQLPAGNLQFDGSLSFGNHTSTPPADQSNVIAGIDRSIYDLALGGQYGNNIGEFSYSAGLKYFQYSDDSSNGIGKLYPELRGFYRVNDRITVYSSFFGDIKSTDISDFLEMDRYVDASFALRNTQDYADFTIGGSWLVTDEVSVSPQFNIDAMRFRPIFVTSPFSKSGVDTSQAENQVVYASKATVLTPTIAARYKKDKWGADVTLNFRSGTADSLHSIPNLAPFDMTAGADYRVNAQFNVRAYIFVLSSRFSDLALKEKLGSAWLLNFHLAYDLQVGQVPLEVFADGRNILNQKYVIWQAYQEFPLSLFIGISSKIL
jgi:hypothetical protein